METLAVYENARFSHLLREGGLPAARIQAILEDATEPSGIATSPRLDPFSRSNLYDADERKRPSSESFNALVEDQAGRLWLSFASGIVRLEKTEFRYKAAVDASYRLDTGCSTLGRVA